MKKTLFFAAVLALALSACGGGSSSAPVAEQSPVAAQSQVPVTMGNKLAVTQTARESNGPYAIPEQLVPQAVAQAVPERVLPEQRIPSLTWSTITPAKPRSIGDILRDMAKVYPIGNTDLNRLAFGADTIDKLRSESLVAGDSSQYLQTVKYLCDYEVRRSYTEWLINDGQHATPDEQRAKGVERDAAARDCRTAGDTLSLVELAVEATKPLALPVDHALQKIPASPAPDALEPGFVAEKTAAMERIQLHQARVQAVLGTSTPERDRRLNCLIDGLNRQLDAWRNSFSYGEVRGKIDQINAEYQARLQAAQ